MDDATGKVGYGPLKQRADDAAGKAAAYEKAGDTNNAMTWHAQAANHHTDAHLQALREGNMAAADEHFKQVGNHRAAYEQLKSKGYTNRSLGKALGLTTASHEVAVDRSRGNSGELNVSDQTYVGAPKVKCSRCDAGTTYVPDLKGYVCPKCGLIPGLLGPGGVAKAGNSEGAKKGWVTRSKGEPQAGQFDANNPDIRKVDASGACPNCGQQLTRTAQGCVCKCGYNGKQEAATAKTVESDIAKVIEDFVNDTESFVVKNHPHPPSDLTARIRGIVETGGQ
jgi:hypothetical protein